MADTINTVMVRGSIVRINGTVEAFAEYQVGDNTGWNTLESCQHATHSLPSVDYAPGWSQKTWTVMHQGQLETYVGPNIKSAHWGRLISDHLLDDNPAQFSSNRFVPKGTIKDLSQVCSTLRQGLKPTFVSGYEDYKQRRKNERDQRIFTLESNDFSHGITKISLRLRLEIKTLGNGDAYTRNGHGVVTIVKRQSHIDHCPVESGTVSNSSVHPKQPAIPVPDPSDYSAWLEKLKPLQEYESLEGYKRDE